MSDLANGLRVLGTQLESLGSTLVERFGALNVWTGALLGGALVLDRLLARRVRASLRIALYAPVALRILLPLDWTIRLANAPRVMTYFTPLTQAGSRPSVELSTWQTPSWYALAAVVYVAVVALLAARAILARVRLGRALADARFVPDSHPDVPCPIVEHEELGPMAVGLFAPRVVLPRRLLAAGEEHALACVLRHEAAHMRRGDAWLSVAMQVLSIVAWPVVPLWIAIARVRQLIELACDEAALTGADATERRLYGHALLDIAEWRSLVVTPLGAGELHFGSTLRARIESLGSQRHWPLAVQAVALSLAPVVLLGACSASAPTAPATTAGGPPSGEKATGPYGYQFESDPAKEAAATATSAPTPHRNSDGRVSPELIQATVRSHWGAYRSCYAAGLRKDPRLTGTVTVKYTIGTNGVTKEAADEKSTLPDKDVIACVVAAFGKLTYPESPTDDVTVVYPVQFEP